jgi:hypothetical protein
MGMIMCLQKYVEQLVWRVHASTQSGNIIIIIIIIHVLI